MEDDIFAPTVARIRIVNHNKFVIEDRCDNIPYTFPPGAPVDIPLDAAHHLFGFHENATEQDIEAHCCKRFGWNTPMLVQSGKAKEQFDNLEIRPVSYKMVEVEEDDGLIKRRPRGRPRKVEADELELPGSNE